MPSAWLGTAGLGFWGGVPSARGPSRAGHPWHQLAPWLRSPGCVHCPQAQGPQLRCQPRHRLPDGDCDCTRGCAPWLDPCGVPEPPPSCCVGEYCRMLENCGDPPGKAAKPLSPVLAQPPCGGTVTAGGGTASARRGQDSHHAGRTASATAQPGPLEKGQTEGPPGCRGLGVAVPGGCGA